MSASTLAERKVACYLVDMVTKKRLPQQQDLVTDVWRISEVRERVERLLSHVTRVQAESIALAAAYGVKHPELAVLANVSRQRIGQLVDQVDITGLRPSEIRRQVDQVEGWPGDVMKGLDQLAHPADVDDIEHRELTRRKVAVVYGHEEADRRHAERSAALAALATDVQRQEDVRAMQEGAHRQVFGAQ